jgi:hypothetical protein
MATPPKRLQKPFNYMMIPMIVLLASPTTMQMALLNLFRILP